jgi:signal transduction histidine kinase
VTNSSEDTLPKWYKGPTPGKGVFDPRLSGWYRRIVAAVGLILLLVGTWIAPPQPEQFWYILLMALFVAFQVIFPLNLLSGEINLIHVVTLGGALLYGPVSAAWAATIGIGLGFAVRWFEERKWVQTSLPPPMDGLDALAMMGMHHTALLVALPAFGWRLGISLDLATLTDYLGSAVPALLVYAAIHTLLYLGNALAQQHSLSGWRRDLVVLMLFETLPLFFVVIVVMGYPASGVGSLILLGGVPVILEVLIYGVNSVRVDLERRAKELASLNQISQVLRSSIDLDQLLEEIHTQVSALFAVENFYIALYNQEEEQIWYPLAVKNSQRVYWPPRQLTDRLTDRVIRKRSPILLPHNARDALVRIGLPAGEDSPTAWMGVPLIASEKAIGCLGVFSFSPDVVFTPADVRWLTTLSGQVSVAIENTLRYQRTQRRADLALTHRVYQLSILEAVGRELAAAIRSDRLLDVILGYALEVTRSEWGSISLYEAGENLLVIKAVRGYQKAIASLSADSGISSRAVHTGQRVYVPDVTQDPDYVDISGGAARSQLSVPMVHEGRVLGVLTLESDQLNAYSASDQVFISQLAAHATIAVVNADLYAQAQERLSELAAILNSVGEGLLVLDAMGQVTLANEALQALTNVPLAGITGKCLSDLPEKALASLGFTKDQADSAVSALKQGIAPSLPRLTIKVNEAHLEKTLERTTFTVWDRKGRITGWTVVIRNITEEVMITQARELITETLIHDLRSPASAVLGALDVLDETIARVEPSRDEVVEQAIEVARRGAQRVLGMIESLLEIARLHAGKIEILQTSFHLRKLAANVMNDFLSQSVEYGVILRNEVPEDLPLVRSDAGKTTRVITNLLDNALKFTPAGGQIILTAERLGADMIAMQVGDTGPGIPEEYREKIFERFTQVPGLVGRRRGSGLGLTFCKLALEAQGGRIWVEPRPGGGSQFIFTLPVNPGKN